MSMRLLSNQKEGSPAFTVKSKFGDIQLRFCDAVYEVSNFAEEDSKYNNFKNHLRLRMEAEYIQYSQAYHKCDLQFYVNGDLRNSIEVVGDNIAFSAIKYSAKLDVDEQLIKQDFYDVVGVWVNENEDLVNKKRKELWDDTLNALYKMRSNKESELSVLNQRIDMMIGVEQAKGRVERLKRWEEHIDDRE